MFEGPEHHAGNFIARMRPDVDDLVVTLAIRDDAFAILLLDLADLFVSILQLSLFLLGNNHVRNSNRDAGLGCFRESELLQFVESRDGRGWASDLVAPPNNVAELLFASRAIEETEFFRPDLIEDD